MENETISRKSTTSQKKLMRWRQGHVWDKIRTTKINTAVVDELLDNIQWFFDDFLPDQYKDHSTAAVFCSRMQDKLDSEYSIYDNDLVATYERETDTAPSVLN